ncbi:MAG TPA: hypothetical protein VKB53_04170 [Gammaproteobacteria bacterium]|nr:hypothetical protein [Gammaproteobacteria bacterium]
MKTNLLYRLKSNAPAGEKRIELKSELTILLLLFVALAGGGCDTLESGSPGAVGAPSSPRPAAATGSSAYAGGSGFAAGLSGQWFHDGKPTSIKVDSDGRNLTIINENGQRSSGYANSPYELEIPSARLKGRVGDGGRRISWNNGTTWSRQPHEPRSDSGQGPGQGLSGRWYHDGKPTSVSMSPGGSVTITNEQGQTSSGHMSGNNDIVLSSLIRGSVSPNGRRISWSNGTEWTR